MKRSLTLVVTQEHSISGGNFTFRNQNEGNPNVENVRDSMLEEMAQQVNFITTCENYYI